METQTAIDCKEPSKCFRLIYGMSFKYVLGFRMKYVIIQYVIMKRRH